MSPSRYPRGLLLGLVPPLISSLILSCNKTALACQAKQFYFSRHHSLAEIPHLKNAYHQILTYFLLKEKRLAVTYPIQFPRKGQRWSLVHGSARMESLSLVTDRRSEEQHRTHVPEGLANFYWSVSIQVSPAHMPALSVRCDRRSNHTETREMQLDGYSYQSKPKHIS